jgi:acylphosphatase
MPTLSSYARTNAAQVQGEAQGSDEAIQQFVQHLNKGPSAASVSGVEHSDISTKSGESGFDVKYS